MTTLNEITYVDWQYKLNSIGEVAQGVEDINQCIAIILLTQKGSDPLRPTFGSDIYKYVDYPVNSAKANIIRESVDAIEKWETRIKIDSVTVEINATQIKVKIQWTLKSSNNTNTKICLHKLKNDAYGWSMPYVSKYHENWFKVYYEIEDAEITWID